MYSLFSFEDSTIDYVIFTPSRDQQAFLINSKFLLENNCNLYLADQLVYADKIHDYACIVIAVGNSEHHFYIWKLLEELEKWQIINKVCLYVHDVFLHNLCFYGKYYEIDKYIEDINKFYKLPKKVFCELQCSKNIREAQSVLMVKYGITGIRFSENMGVKRFLVNSNNACKLLKRDLTKSAVVDSVFLPILKITKAIKIAIYYRKTKKLNI